MRRWWIVFVIIASMLLLSLVAAPMLPDRVPIRWDANGEPSGSMPKAVVLLTTPMLAVAAWVLVEYVRRAAGRRGLEEASRRIVPAVGTALIGLFAVVHMLTMGRMLG
jgi:uncharacterized membrane protein